MTQITSSLNNLNFSTDHKDRLFIQRQVSRQYMNQCNDTYAAI